jgi:hypothetical protein
MQATGTLQEARFSKGFILVVVAMLCALLLGAAGGYAVRSSGSATGTPAVVHPGVDLNQNGPNSDLTRVLPTAYPDPAAGYDISQWTGTSAASNPVAGSASPEGGLIP